MSAAVLLAFNSLLAMAVLFFMVAKGERWAAWLVIGVQAALWLAIVVRDYNERKLKGLRDVQ